MEEPELTRRQERAAERMLEDEGLAGGLSDEPARAIIAWAQRAALAAAAPPERTDEQVAALLQAIRRAARQAAATTNSPGAPLQLVADADKALAGLAPELWGGAGGAIVQQTDDGRRATDDRRRTLRPGSNTLQIGSRQVAKAQRFRIRAPSLAVRSPYLYGVGPGSPSMCSETRQATGDRPAPLAVRRVALTAYAVG